MLCLIISFSVTFGRDIILALGEGKRIIIKNRRLGVKHADFIKMGIFSIVRKLNFGKMHKKYVI